MIPATENPPFLGGSQIHNQGHWRRGMEELEKIERAISGFRLPIHLENQPEVKELDDAISNLHDIASYVLNKVESECSEAKISHILKYDKVPRPVASLLFLLKGFTSLMEDIKSAGPIFTMPEVHKIVENLGADLINRNIDLSIESQFELNIELPCDHLTSIKVNNSFINVFTLFIKHIAAILKREGIYYPNGLLAQKKTSGINAANAKYKTLREFKEKAAAAAKKEWEAGSTRRHHEMARYLADDYLDENGKHPFMHLLGKDKNGNYLPSDRVLRKQCKQVAKDIDRLDLISGNKKLP